jgi:hypothetical protein
LKATETVYNIRQKIGQAAVTKKLNKSKLHAQKHNNLWTTIADNLSLSTCRTFLDMSKAVLKLN